LQGLQTKQAVVVTSLLTTDAPKGPCGHVGCCVLQVVLINLAVL
jgi:hypothetical protein